MQAYNVQAQAYLYNTYTSNLYKRMQVRQVCASYNLDNFAQVVQAYTVQAQAYLYNTCKHK